MRRIGTLQDSTQARHFCDYLVTLSIDAAVDSDGEGQDACWDIWIRDEKDVERARQAFTPTPTPRALCDHGPQRPAAQLTTDFGRDPAWWAVPGHGKGGRRVLLLSPVSS